jgi:hypothetical protein
VGGREEGARRKVSSRPSSPPTHLTRLHALLDGSLGPLLDECFDGLLEFVLVEDGEVLDAEVLVNEIGHPDLVGSLPCDLSVIIRVGSSGLVDLNIVFLGNDASAVELEEVSGVGDELVERLAEAGDVGELGDASGLDLVVERGGRSAKNEEKGIQPEQLQQS